MADCDNDQECEKIVPKPIKPEPLPKQCSGGGESGEGTNDFNELENRPKYGGRKMTGDTDIPEYSTFTGTDGQTDGTTGLVPAPASSDADKFLKSDGTWAEVGGGSDINVVQTAGTSQDDVMSQNAATSMIFTDPSTRRTINIGGDSVGVQGVNIGFHAKAGQEALAIGRSANSSASGASFSVALGPYSVTSRRGEVNVGTGTNPYGYNNTNYRVIGGVHDGQDAHDAVNVEQINALIDALNTATGANISHIGA